MSCCLHTTVDSCTREFVWMKQFHQATTSATTCQWTFLSCFISIYNCRLKHAWVCLILTVFPNNSKNNHCSINIVNCQFPIYLFNWCAIKFSLSTLSFNDSRNTYRMNTINQLESRQSTFHENFESIFVACNLRLLIHARVSLFEWNSFTKQQQ